VAASEELERHKPRGFEREPTAARSANADNAAGDVCTSERIKHGSGQSGGVGGHGHVRLGDGWAVQASEARVRRTIVDDGAFLCLNTIEGSRLDRENTALGRVQEHRRRRNALGLGRRVGEAEARGQDSSRGTHLARTHVDQLMILQRMDNSWRVYLREIEQV
jgi:hypothetical protein